MNKFLLLSCFLILIISCNNKNKNNNKDVTFFPVKSYIKSQITNVDTSVYSIIKVVTVNGVSDTSYIKREEFSTYAKEFLTVPDISSDDYKETNIYDEFLERAIVNYTTEDKEAEVQRVEVIIDPGSEDNVESIFIDRIIDNKNKIITKRMLWEVDKRFRITTISQEGNKEKIETLDVMWNGNPSAE